MNFYDNYTKGVRPPTTAEIMDAIAKAKSAASYPSWPRVIFLPASMVDKLADRFGAGDCCRSPTSIMGIQLVQEECAVARRILAEAYVDERPGIGIRADFVDAQGNWLSIERVAENLITQGRPKSWNGGE